MSSISLKVNSVDTPYKKVMDSNQVQFVKDKPFIATVGTLGAATLLASVAEKSELVLNISKKGIIPAIATGVALTGGAMVHDTIVNNKSVVDDKNTPNDEHFENVLGKTLEGGIGTTMLLGGTEVAGRSFGVSPVIKPVEKLFTTDIIKKVSLPVIGLGLAAGGVALIHDTIANNVPVPKEKQAGPYDLSGDEALHAVGKTIKIATGLGATVGGTNLLAKGIGINLKPVAPFVAPAIFLGLTGASVKSMKDSGAGVLNTGVFATTTILASTFLTEGGFKETTTATSQVMKTVIKNSDRVVGGIGLGVLSYGMAKTSVGLLNSNGEGHKGMGVVLAVGSAASAATSITLLGNTLAPKLFDNNPLLAVGLVATTIGVGSYMMYSNNKEAEEKAKLKK